MPVYPLDTFKSVNALTAAGLPAAQAEAVVRIVVDTQAGSTAGLATEETVERQGKELRREIADLRKDMDAGFADLRKDMAAEFAKVRAETAAEFVKVRAEMTEMDTRLSGKIDVLGADVRAVKAELHGQLQLLRWMFAVLATVGLGTLAKLFSMRGTP